jgi:predicted nucleic acid-binding protein
MPERWAVNASPLILLAKIEHLHLLNQLADELVIPNAVIAEVNAGPVDDPARRILASAPLPIVADRLDPTIMTWDLGDGETAVLSYAAIHAGWTAVIDDGAARRCARALAIPMLGTLGILLRARRAGLIAATVPLLQALRAKGIRLDDEVIRRTLMAVTGETWE